MTKDWEGVLNKNNTNRALTGFWIESSLQITPKEQVEVLSKILEPESSYKPENIQALKKVMQVDQEEIDGILYGKTGYGKLGNTSLDSWFVGMVEKDKVNTYFAVYLGASDDPNVTSALAKEIAIELIKDL